ncbi:MAG TPA: hypothetical protein VJZ26_16225 [Blastocatellia bacterium]|nr:hypothetical protein [Blastocatellia bacterium]
MKKNFRLITLAFCLASSASYAQNLDAFAGPFDSDFRSENETEARTDVERVNRVGSAFRSKEFIMSKFDADAIEKFGEAWKSTGNGTTSKERVILILRMADGSYGARLQRITNEYKSCAFSWHPATVAVVHTHPNNSDPKPQGADIQIADKYGVLMFTITARGMYLYDPSAKKTTKVQEGLDWLNSASWEKVKAQLKP